LLEDGERAIKEVAFAVGYSDPNYFSRTFKKFTGISPTTYAHRGKVDD
jgi:two-component system response regulator YesN